MPYLALGESFGLAPVSPPVLLALFGITAAYVAISEIVKQLVFRRSRSAEPNARGTVTTRIVDRGS